MQRFLLTAASLLLLAGSVAALPLNQPRLDSPTRLTLNPAGQVVVSDYVQKAVVLVDRGSGQPVGGFTIRGRPLGVAASGQRIYVGNETTQSIQVYAGGSMVQNFGSGDALARPLSLAIDPNLRRLFVLEAGSRRIVTYTLLGSRLGSIDLSGSAAWSLLNPTAMAIDPAVQEIYVSDYGVPGTTPPRIQVYDYSGNHLASLPGSVPSGMLGKSWRFSRPQGLAAAAGRIYLSDALLGQVLVLDRSSGAVLGALGSFGNGEGQLQLPLDVLRHPNGDLLVADNRNRRIVTFAGGGTTP